MVQQTSKRARFDEDATTNNSGRKKEMEVFDGVPAIQLALRANGGHPSTGIIETLTTLRNQLTLRHPEMQALIDNSQTTSKTASTSKTTATSGSYLNALPTVIQPSDPRLLLLEKWCQSSAGLEELFNVWDLAAEATPSGGWSKSAQGMASIASSVASLSVSVLGSILTLLSAYYTFHAHAYPVLKNVFENERWKRLCGYISGVTPNDLVLATLRLLTVIVERWDGKKVLEGFVWEAKSLAKLLQTRRKGSSPSLIKPDVRTSYILFLVAFILPASSTTASYANSQTKAAFLQQHGFHYTSIFKNLHQDAPAIVRRVLEVSWEGVWCDVRVSRSLKVGVFAGLSGGVLQNLLKLYERTEEEEDGGYAVADLVHHFLLAICTRPGVGLCFKDRGWYPRDVGGDTLFNADDSDPEENTGTKKPKLYNPTLLNLLKSLKPTDDPRQNELALKILNVAPELVAIYLPQSGLTLDPPRLSSKWIANLSFFVTVVGGEAGQGVEDVERTGGFRLKEDGDEIVYRPTPPPLSTTVNNVVPGGGASRLNMRNVFTKGLQFVIPSAAGKGSASANGNLVQHTTALALIRCLDKLRRVRGAMDKVAKALGEGELTGISFDVIGQAKEGLWTKRAKEVVKEVRRRVPEFQVVLAFCTAHLKTSTTSANGEKKGEEGVPHQDESEGVQIRRALMAECAMRLLWMYQEALPEVVEEARFDVGKVLVGFEVGMGAEVEAPDNSEGEGESEEDEAEEHGEGDEDDHEQQKRAELEPISTPIRLQRLTQLHILRFLRASPAFSFSAPSPTHAGHTHLYTLLMGLVNLNTAALADPDSSQNQIGVELKTLVRHSLGRSIAFQWTGQEREVGQDEEDLEVDAWLDALPRVMRRVRDVKRLVDANADDEQEAGQEGKLVTVYPESLDGTPLMDERTSVVTFLEDCILRCIKTPYKYIEELEKMAAGSSQQTGNSDQAFAIPVSNSLPSPLLVTMIEQLEAKIASQAAAGGSGTIHLSPSDVLAITVYLRSLLFALVGKFDCGFTSTASPSPYVLVLEKVLDRMEALGADGVWEKAFGGEEHAVVRKAMMREIVIARRCLGLEAPEAVMDVDGEEEGEDADVDDFLDLIEALEIPSPFERRLTVYELIDWVRLLGTPLNQVQTNRLWGAVGEIWPDGLVEVVKYLDVPNVRTNPENGVSVWGTILAEGHLADGDEEKMDVDEQQDDLDKKKDQETSEEDNDDEENGEEKEELQDFDPSDLSFEYLLVHALPHHLPNPKCQEVLAHCALNYCGFDASPISSPSSTSGASISHIQRLHYVTRHILRRFSVFLAIKQAEAARALLFVLGAVLEQVKVDDASAFGSAKELVVGGLKELLGVASPSSLALDAESLTAVRQGILSVLKVVLDAGSLEDRALVSEVASGWIEVLKDAVSGEADRGGDLEFAGEWIAYAQPGEVLEVLSVIVRRPEMIADAAISRVTSSCLRALKDALRAGQQVEFRRQLSNSSENVYLLFHLHSLLLQLKANAREAGREEEERDKVDGVKVVEELIAAVLESEGVPIGLAGDQELPLLVVERNWRDAVEDAEMRWNETLSRRRGGAPVTSQSITSFLSQPLEDWTESTEKIVCSFLYSQTNGDGSLVRELIQWAVDKAEQLGGETEGRGSVVGVIHAILDCALHREQASASHLTEKTELADLLLQELIGGGERRSQAKAALQFFVELSAGDEARSDSTFALVERRVKTLRKSITSSSALSSSLAPELINLARWLVIFTTDSGSTISERALSIGNEVVELATQWLVRKLGDEEGQKDLDKETSAICVSAAALIKVSGVACKATTLETLLGVIVQSQYHVARPECLEVLDAALPKASLKPLVVNKYLQGIVQHPHFFKLAAFVTSPSPTHSPLTKIRDSVILLLHTLFFLHPTNTCQISHIEPLIRVYGGTLSVSDRRILSIFTLFERQRRLSVRSIVARWAPPSSSLAGAVANGGSVGLEALQNLDPILALRTALAFPVWRHMDEIANVEGVETGKQESTSHEAQLYDPRFILLLLLHVLSNGPPTSAISWIELFRSNAVGLALRALSAKDGKVRELGMGCTVALWSLMQNADLQERDYVVHLLELLKNAVSAPSKEGSKMNVDGDEDSEGIYPPRLPSYITLLLFHSLRGIFNPSTFVYPLTSRFLLQRPELDITDVPMLYSMLYSSDTEDWKKERGWIVRFLADGIYTGSAVSDWRLLKRRHVWDLIASMYQSANTSTSAFSLNDGESQSASGGDRALKQSILEFLVNVTRHRSPTMSLVLKSGLLAWIEVQLNGPDRHAGNGVEWLKVLENICVVADVKKLEGSALQGQWARTIGRCVHVIVEQASNSPSSLPSTLPLAIRIALRLCLVAPTGQQALLSQCLSALRTLEADIKPPFASLSAVTIPQLDDLLPAARHSSHGIHDKLAPDDQTLFFIWGRSVESLWRATMNVEVDRVTGTQLWNSLTARILLWRRFIGADECAVAEWARIECVRNMGMSS